MKHPGNPGKRRKDGNARALPRGQRPASAGTQRVTISESDGVRYLHFGTIWVQGAMRVARPFALELDYQRQMMAAALFLPQPGRIVQLGLGAAALAKFCWREYPEATITAVEVSADVVAAACAWFKLPEDDRIELAIEDARDFVSHPHRRRTADWLQVDLYDAAARGPVYDDAGFYAACRRVLANPGVAVFNLFGRRFDPSFDAIARAFDDRAIALPEADAGNRIVLAFAGAPIDVEVSALTEGARRIESRLRLPAIKWVNQLRAQIGYADRLLV